jgi:hypothetical protein
VHNYGFKFSTSLLSFAGLFNFGEYILAFVFGVAFALTVGVRLLTDLIDGEPYPELVTP